jgi:hypothetical protein
LPFDNEKQRNNKDGVIDNYLLMRDTSDTSWWFPTPAKPVVGFAAIASVACEPPAMGNFPRHHRRNVPLCLDSLSLHN